MVDPSCSSTGKVESVNFFTMEFVYQQCITMLSHNQFEDLNTFVPCHYEENFSKVFFTVITFISITGFPNE